DDDGIAWPMAIAPYHVIVTPIGKGDDVKKAAQDLYDGLVARGVEALLDDRDERPGVKFKDADLLGIPLRVTVGGRGLAAGELELKRRTEAEPTMVPVAECADRVRDVVLELGGRLRPGA